MTRQFAMEGAPHWIRCNSISPGTVKSPGLDLHAADPRLLRRSIGRPLMNRIGRRTTLHTQDSSWHRMSPYGSRGPISQ
jgi:NAD(P)-dependent dehydrogenase (short-subunit alcohol dehydrogenase family)